MRLKVLILTQFIVFGIGACASGQPTKPEIARAIVADTWQTNRHIVWEIEWPDAPIGGPLTVETWRANERYRFEILESTAPALVGETLVFDGQQAWRYNRFATELPAKPSSPRLSPVSDAFAFIDRLIATLPETATQESVQLDHGPAQKITLTFDDGDWLILWRDDKTKLPARIHFSVGGKQASLNARSVEPLTNPPDGLFEPGD